jgi:DUF1009 family protein
VEGKLGILAGSGDLPARLIEACRETGRQHFVLAFEGEADKQAIASAPHAWVRLGNAGRGFELLHENGVDEVVFAGAIRRPSVASLRPDSAVIKEVESEGFRVIGAETLLPSALAREGLFGRHRPDEQAEADIRRGMEIVRALGSLDIGQAVVVQQGMVLGVEAIEGTDALIRRCAALRREGPGGVLVKAAKRGQERRADLQTIGVGTVRAATAARLRGIAVEAGSTLVIDAASVARAADEAGLFVVGVASGSC